MTREDVAKAYIQSAHARAARAGVIAFGAGLALVVLWSAQLQHRTGGLLRALAEKPRQTDLALQRSGVQGRSAVEVQRLRAAQEGSKRSKGRRGYIENLDAEANLLGQQVNNIEQRTAEATNVTFRLPGLPEIEVREASAALVWLACAAMLLQYLAWCRGFVLTLYSRALRILVSETKVDPAILHDMAGPLPFWIAPLPRRDGAHVSVNLLRSAAGWDRTSARHYISVAFIQLAAGLIVLHVVYLGVVFSQVGIQPSNPVSLLSNTPVLPITVLVGLTFAGIAFWWLRPGVVPDAYSFESDQSHAPGRGRRAVLLTGLGLVAAALSLVAVSPAAMRRAILRPRFRRWANRQALAMGYYEVGRSKRIHYARGESRPKRLKSVPDRHIRRVEPDRDQLLRIHPSAIEPWLAEASLRFKVSEFDLAKEGMDRALSTAKAGMPVTLTWFERVAEEARAAGNSDEIERTIESVDALAGTTGGRGIAELIERRRGQWSKWVTELTRSREKR